MLLIGVLVVGLLSDLTTSDCNFYEATFYCKNVTQDDFVDELFSHMAYLNENKATKIRIEDSDFTTIEDFPRIQLLIPNFDLKDLVITRSKVKSISRNAFADMGLKSLDLSYNDIDDFNFICNSEIGNIILSHNYINELDLNCFSYSSYNIEVYLDNNEISVIKPFNYTRELTLSLLDVSFNKLSEFSEIELNVIVDYLNISYNNLESIELRDKSTLSILSNNTQLRSLTKNDIFTSRTMYTSFIPQNALYIYEVFSMANTFIGILNESLSLNSYRESILVDFSNTSLTDISENYFETISTSYELNLSHNNFSILNTSLFGNSVVTKIDLSFSRIQNISKQCFHESTSFFKSLNLTGNLLETITDLCETAQHLNVLDLSANNFTKIYSTMLSSCSMLEHLNMSQCQIESFEPGTFSNLQLNTINLSRNKLTILPNNSFDNLNTLITIDLSDNSIETIESNAFLNLPSIQNIDLSRNKIKILYSHTFTGLGVRNINFEGNYIRYIQTKAFDGLYNLAMVNLSNVGLSILENDVFFNMSHIDTIDLSYNNIMILDNYTFQNIPISHINLTGNGLKKIHYRAFYNLKYLRQLNLSGLIISELDEESFSNMHSLQFIDLRNNNLSYIEIGMFKDITVKNIYLSSISKYVHQENSVRVLNLTLRFNGTLKEKALSSMYLKSLHIIDSQLDLLSNCFFGSYGLQELHFLNTNISSYEPGFLNGLYSLLSLNGTSIFKNVSILEGNLFKDLFNLHNLILSDINFEAIDENAFIGLSKSLKYLHLNGNKFATINFTVFNNLNLTYLDLSHNPLTSINFTIITEALPYLNILNISSCTIQQLYSSKFNFKTNALQYLDLSNNMISVLDSNIFASFGNLIELQLNSNRISSIDYMTFNLTNNLERLRLDNNHLTSLKVGIFDGTRSLTFLNISNYNKFSPPSDITGLLNLKQLITLYMDQTKLKTFSYETLVSNLSHLRKIGINYNNMRCNYLLEVLYYFDRNGIDYTAYNPIFDVQNYNGIKCD